MKKQKPNSLFLCVLGVSLAAHLVLLAYIKLPDVKQIGPLQIKLAAKKKPPPPKKEPEPKPEPPPKPKPPEPKPKPPKPKVRPKPKPPEPKPEPPKPPPIIEPEPVKPDHVEPKEEISLAPEEVVVASHVPGDSEGVPEGLPGGEPDGTGNEPVFEESDPEPTPPAIDYDALWREYAITVISKIQRAKQYPTRAKRRKQTGRVTVQFTVSQNGSVSGVSIASGSGHSALDDEAVNAVSRSAPFPPIPAELNATSKTMTVTLKFEIR